VKEIIITHSLVTNQYLHPISPRISIGREIRK
jgi:hypothetical protein